MSSLADEGAAAVMRDRKQAGFLLGVTALLWASFAPGPVHAASFPAHPIRVIVGQAPGGSTDVVARLVAIRLSETLGASVVVENRTGNAGSLAADYVAKSKPDGLTLLIVSSSYSINPSLSKLPFDAQKDLAPVSLLAEAPFLLVVNPKFPARDFAGFMQLAAAQPGRLTYGSGGNGSSGHLAGALLQQLAKLDFVHVPYKGAGPALTDVMGGHIDFLFASVLSSSQPVAQGLLHALAVTSAKRSPALPDVPTVAESGVPGYSATTWYALLAPAGTPDEVITALTKAAKLAVQSPSVRDVLLQDGAEPIGSSPAELKAYLAAELSKWAALVKRFDIKAE